jgi:hypothetical protein
MTKTLNFECVSFGHFVIRYSNLFRISDFDIRILPERDFSFKHYLAACCFMSPSSTAPGAYALLSGKRSLPFCIFLQPKGISLGICILAVD